MKYYLSPTAPGPLARFLAGVVALLVMVGLLFFGLIALAMLVALITIAVAVSYLRIWWLRQKPGNAFSAKTSVARPASVIETEYKVVSRRQE